MKFIDMDFEFLDNGEFIDTGYGYMANNGIEVCSDREMFEIEEVTNYEQR